MAFKKLKQMLRPRAQMPIRTQSDVAGGQPEHDQPLRGTETNTPMNLVTYSEHPQCPHEPILVPSGPVGTRLGTGGSGKALSPNREAEEAPIHELWNMAYEDLRDTDNEFIVKYEERLRNNFTAGLASTISLTLGSRVDRRDQMHAILQRKMDEVNSNMWKIKFGSSEILVKDLVQPILGVVSWTNEFIKTAASANTSASIAWGGVSLLLPLFLNPTTQAASLAKGLQYISSLVVKGHMWEALYIRRCEPSTTEMEQFAPSRMERVAFKDALQKLYLEILRFQIASYCYYDRNSGLRFGQDTIKWNEWDNLMKSIQEQEGRFASINAIWGDTTYAAEHSAAHRRYEEVTRRWQTIGNDVSNLLVIIETAQTDKKRQEFLNWLCTIDPSEAYNAARDKHMSGTSDWLIKGSEFEAWEASERSLLWLYGKPGCGKSVLSSSVIRHLRDQYSADPRTALAYFFFSFSDPSKQTLNGMLASLLKQLYARRPDTPRHMKTLFEYMARGERPDSQTLEAAVLATTHGFSEIFVIIDALDDCPTTMGERSKLLNSLRRIISTMPSNLHILCTSRAEPDIVSVMKTVLDPPSRAEIDLTIHHVGLDEDIGLYIDKMLESNNYASWPVDLKAEAKGSLIKTADGMFQYIFCQFEALQDLSSVSLVRKELRRLPFGLDATYERLLLGLDRRFGIQILGVLKWLASSIRDLKLEELAETFMLNPYSDVVFDHSYRLFKPADFLKYMSSLIVVQKIPPRKTTYVRLAHSTVREFLMSDRITECLAKAFSFSESDAHLHIAHCSLAYHLHCVHFGPKLSHFSLLDYASHNWMAHLETVPPDLWSTDIVRLAIQALAMRSKSLRLITRDVEYEFEKLAALFGTRWPLRTELSQRPHIYTALKGFTNLTKMLIGGGPGTNPYLVQEDLDMALHYAAYEGRIGVVQLLMDNGADCDSGIRTLESAPHAAALGAHKAVVKLLLETGAIETARQTELISALKNSECRNYLDVMPLPVSRESHVRASSGDAKRALAPTILGVPMVNHKEIKPPPVDYGTSALGSGAQELVAQKGTESARCADVCCDGVRCRHGKKVASRRSRKQFSYTSELIDGPMMGTSANDHESALRTIAGASQNCPASQSLLHRAVGAYGSALQAACVTKNIEDVVLLLNQGVDVNAVGGVYGTALQAACHQAWTVPDIPRVLIEHGANIQQQGGVFGSAWHAAAAGCSDHVLQLLLEHGSNINDARGRKFATALQATLESTSFGVGSRFQTDRIEFLLDRGANADIGGGEYGFPLQSACAIEQDGGEKVTGFLLRKCPEINVYATGGLFGSALQAAAYSGQTESVAMLLERGVDVNVQGGIYRSALNAAIIRGYWDIVEVLLKEGAVPSDQPDDQWLGYVLSQLGRGAVERYVQFWERMGSLWNATIRQ